MDDSASAAEYGRRLNASLQLMDTSYADQLTLDDVAATAHFSKYHFHRLFLATYGETPGEYLRRVRLEKAAQLLKMRFDYTITRIAMETGFSSPAVFSRAFRKHFGTTAKVYRQRSRTARNLADVGSARCRDRRFDESFAPTEIRRLERLHLVYVRSMAGYGPVVSKAWRTLFAWAYTKGLVVPGVRLFGIPLDDPEITPTQRCRYLSALTVAEPAEAEGRIERMTLESGWYAVFPFEDSPDGIGRLYERVYGAWLPRSGYQPDDRPTLEEYPAEYAQPGVSHESGPSLRFTLLFPVRPL